MALESSGHGLTPTMRSAAGQLGRGRTIAATAKTIGISERTLKRWKTLPEFRAELERVRAQADKPSPEGSLIDALSATLDDNVNWTARIAAAKALMALHADNPDRDPELVGHVGPVITVVAE